MQLARFNRFLEEVLSEPDLKTNVQHVSAFRLFRAKWYDTTNAVVADPALVERLSSTLKSGQPWRARRSLDVFLPIPELESVLIARFYLPPKSATSKAVLGGVRDCLKHSNNAFDATHDALTGLLNQAELERVLKRLLAQGSAAITKGVELVGSAAASRAIHIFALDVDHFKQCNDSYGHQFGNLVLQVLARRLEALAGEISRERPDLDPLIVARPHGEEFFLVAIGSAPKSELVRIGEKIRLAIRDRPIPSEEEWLELKNQYASELTLPHITDRRVTVSIGITTLPSLEKAASEDDDDVADAISTCLREADVALYKAKSGGRDTVRHYSDILQQYGTVLEHHNDTDIVAIDLGSGVGVLKGQEFLVFHPDFSGSKPFVYSDGRSKRRLGSYPKRPSGHIEVFDVQQEISFCRVVRRSSPGPFPAHSLLEAVPLGSISHLFSSDSRANPSEQPELGNAQQLREHASALVKRGEAPAACVFTIENASSVQKERGSAFVNQALARIYTAISRRFTAQTVIGQIDNVTIAVVTKTSTGGVTDVAGGVIQDCEGALGGRVKVVAGVFDGKSRSKDNADQKKLDLTKALEFATYAASSEARLGDVQEFSPAVASRIVASSRTRRNFAKALKDYQDLTSYGVTSAFLENQAALCAFDREDQDLVLAREHIEKARKMLPSEGILSANLGIIEYRAGNYSAAHDAFQHAAAIEGFNWPENYKAVRAHAAYKAFKAAPAQVEAAIVIGLLDEAAKLPNSSHHFIASRAIQEAKADPVMALFTVTSGLLSLVKPAEKK